MAKGKQTEREKIYLIMSMWAVSGNYSEIARECKMPLSTVRKIVLENKDKSEYVELCNQKRANFSKKADGIINKALNRLEKVLDDENKDIPVNHLTTAIGTLFDKKALADGKPTERTEIIGGDKLSKLAELAGYERKQ